MSDNLILPSWLSRGIEEYFPIKGTYQTFIEIIDHAKKNNKKLGLNLESIQLEQIFILVTAYCLKNLGHSKIMDILQF